MLGALGLPSSSKKRMYKGKGCEKCLNTGYYGRTGIFELLVVDKEMRKMITGQASEAEIYDKAVENGMLPVRDAAIEKVYSGLTTAEEVLRNIVLS